MIQFLLLSLGMLFFVSMPHAEGVNVDEILAAHNKWRAQVGVGKLKYSTELAESAQAWANTLKNTNQCLMRHSKPAGRYGENLYWASAIVWSDGRRELQKQSSESAVNSWGSEKRDYNYASNRCATGKVCGHYTQMVWQKTNLVGCALAVCDDTLDQVWVCQYQPAGNWVGQKPY
jgi:pathogenesis-related protein 1